MRKFIVKKWKKANQRLKVIALPFLMVGIVTAASLVFAYGINDNKNGLVLDIDFSQDNYNSGTRTFADKSGSGNNAISTNPAVFTADKNGQSNKAMSFTSTNDEIVIPHNSSYKSASITVSFWYKPQNINKRHVIFTSWYGFTTEINADRTFKWGLNGLSGQYFGTKKVNWDEWIYLTGTFDNSSKQQCIYFNGAKQECQTVTGSISYGTSALYLSGSWDWIGGDFANAKIYNRALSETEIKDLYNSSKTKIQSSSLEKGLIGYWPLDASSLDAGNNTASDRSAYGNSGINYGADPVFDRNGQEGKAVKINDDEPPLLLNYRLWKEGQTGAIGPFGIYNLAANNTRIIAEDPWGRKVPVWQSSSLNAGIYASAQPIDNTKLYRFSWWEKSVSSGEATYGRYYAGLNGYGSTNGVINLSAGTYNTNPYFWSTTNIPTSSYLPEGQWVLVVGHVFPYNYSGTDRHSDSGLYTTDGKFANTSADYKWAPETTTARGRTLAIYQANAEGVIHYTVYPRMDVVDGSEPSIQDLLNGYDSYGDAVEAVLPEAPTSLSFWYAPFPGTAWTHVVKSGGNYYVNGEPGTPSVFPVTVDGSHIYMGRTSLSDFFNGSLAEVRAYNRTLSTEEIKSLYEQNKTKISSGSLNKGLILDMPLTSKYTKSSAIGSQIMTDNTPYSHDGQNYGGSVSTDGTLLSATGQRIETDLQVPNEEGTISIWYKPIYSSTDANRNSILYSTGASWVDNSFELALRSCCGNPYDNVLYMQQPGPSYLRFEWEQPIWNANEWINLVITYSSRNFIRPYVNGVLQTASQARNNGTFNFPNKFIIGARNSSTVSAKGTVSDLKVYNRVLSDEEIQSLYDRGRGKNGTILNGLQ
ncbi:MAG: sialidase domain-containing protein [Patescibacteria group bacterium]|nr:sialidase domain-containing protein [Patescibacteria group bacterium]